ncbi:hypothetical protein [Prochlorococcus marinus]|nr:hypothetical protein [Prochlorococcus marinus]
MLEAAWCQRMGLGFSTSATGYLVAEWILSISCMPSSWRWMQRN